MQKTKKAVLLDAKPRLDNRYNKVRRTFVFDDNGRRLLRTFTDATDTRAGQIKFISKMLGERKLPAGLVIDKDTFETLISSLKNKAYLLTTEPSENGKFENIIDIRPANSDDFKVEQ